MSDISRHDDPYLPPVNDRCGGCRDLGPHNYGNGCEYNHPVEVKGEDPYDDLVSVEATLVDEVKLTALDRAMMYANSSAPYNPDGHVTVEEVVAIAATIEDYLRSNISSEM